MKKLAKKNLPRGCQRSVQKKIPGIIPRRRNLVLPGSGREVSGGKTARKRKVGHGKPWQGKIIGGGRPKKGPDLGWRNYPKKKLMQLGKLSRDVLRPLKMELGVLYWAEKENEYFFPPKKRPGGRKGQEEERTGAQFFLGARKTGGESQNLGGEPRACPGEK